MIWLLFGQRAVYDVSGSYTERMLDNINLIPFATLAHQIYLTQSESDYLVRHAIINLGGNVIMFIPLGLLMPSIWQKLRSFASFILGVFVIIAAVETIQFVTLLGSMDIDDLILNLCGASIGFALNVAIRTIYNKIKKGL